MDASTKELAKQLLAKGHNKTEVAEECGVSRRTIIRWSQEPDFMTFVDNADNADNSHAEKAEKVEKVEILEPLDDDLDSLLSKLDDTPVSEILKPRTVTTCKLNTMEKLKYLASVRNTQKSLSATADDHTFKLLELCGQVISDLQKNPEDLNARMLPQLVKAADTVSKIAEETRKRADSTESKIQDMARWGHLEIDDIEINY